MESTSNKISKLKKIIARLREPDGCPWDIKQTPQTFKHYLIEEAHELYDALDLGNPDHIREELGDLLFQIIFINNLFEENGHFSFDDVIDGITEKMIRRHPHVFENYIPESEEALRRKWQSIKDIENKDKNNSIMASLPKSLPTMLKAQKISSRAARCGFEWQDMAMPLEKLSEEITELKEALVTENKSHIAEEIGDILFTTINIARLCNVNADEALQKVIKKFVSRFSEIEKSVTEQGKKISDHSLEELLVLWNHAKQKNRPNDQNNH
ncbi:MAG: nucleoside triphosphate pyrophosphohydrolase [Proteobacteria bacterium]|nr:nucleoside triphosphate pyrophosphohydrolase [Pseudomonadota bacterium]MBU1711027.1 nucleoside triphosphate pyrophosphohydrolase [Pseudomonadota bacterium]